MRITKESLTQIILEEVQAVLGERSRPAPLVYDPSPQGRKYDARKQALEKKLCPPIAGTGEADSNCKAGLNIETELIQYLPPCKTGVHPEMCNSKINDLGLRDDEWMVIQSSCKHFMERRGGVDEKTLNVELVRVKRCNYKILDPENAEKSKPPKRMVKTLKLPSARKRRKKKRRAAAPIGKKIPRKKPDLDTCPDGTTWDFDRKKCVPPKQPKIARPQIGYKGAVGLPGSVAGLPGEEYVKPGR
jgi:hypothetical protein